MAVHLVEWKAVQLAVLKAVEMVALKFSHLVASTADSSVARPTGRRGERLRRGLTRELLKVNETPGSKAVQKAVSKIAPWVLSMVVVPAANLAVLWAVPMADNSAAWTNCTAVWGLRRRLRRSTAGRTAGLHAVLSLM
jgi:hypothetical protein